MNQKSDTKIAGHSARYLKYRRAVAFVESFSNTSVKEKSGSKIKKEYRKDLDSDLNAHSPGKTDPAFFLARTRHFLDMIGSPDKGSEIKSDKGQGASSFKYIHITGTAGKGTVSTMVHEMLSAEGWATNKKAGLFTSPYVTASIEKIKVGDKYISPEEFTEIVESLKPAIRKAATQSPYGAPSAFELSLAIALVYFKKQKCEWVVLEVGLGGRFDATNIIESPKVTAITTIDYDHTEILGKTLRKIAYDKAGIIKRGSQFFTSEQRPELLSLFKKICKEEGATYHHIGKQSDYRQNNVMLARNIGEALGVSKKSTAAGTKNTKLPCRFEIIDTKPLIILDGAHNRAKIASTIGNMQKLRKGKKFKKLIAIVAISDTKKDNRAILAPLAVAADAIIVTSLSGKDRKSVHPAALIPYIKTALRKNKKQGTPIEIIMDPHKALAAARKLAKNTECILATGSFFLAGELRKSWFSEEWVLKNRRSFK